MTSRPLGDNTLDRARIRSALDAIEQEALADEAARLPVREVWERWRTVYQHRLTAWPTEARRAQHVLDFLGDQKAERLTLTDIAHYRDKRRAELTERGGRRTSPATRNREVDLLKRWLNFGVREGVIYRNPIAHEQREKEPPPSQTKVESEAKLEQLLARASAVTAALILLYFDCGLRRLEAMRLKWSDIDGDRVHITQTKTREARRPKLSPRALAALALLPRKGPWVFANPKTYKPYNPRTLTRWFEQTVREAGLVGVGGARVTWHKIRHGFAYRCRRHLKLPEKVTMKMGGWKTRVAFDRYGIVDEEEAEEGWEVIARAGLQRRVRKGPVRKSLDRKAPQSVPPKSGHSADRSEQSRP